MKRGLTLILMMLSLSIHAQSRIENSISCDSVVMKDGTVKIVQVQSVTRRKVNYILCCGECGVPREFLRAEIDTIIYNVSTIEKTQQEKKSVDVEKTNYRTLNDEKSYLELTLKHRDKRFPKKMKNGTRTIIRTSDYTRIKGRFYIVNADSIFINDTILALTDLQSITKPNGAAKVVGTLAGSFFVFIGGVLIADFGLNGEGLSYAGISSAVATPFFAMNLIRRKFNLVNKWNVEVGCKRLQGN